MNNITDDDLILLYYGDHDDPSLAATVAASPELTARFDALCVELGHIDGFIPPQRGEDFGADIWRQISPRLASVPVHPLNRLRTWMSALAQPGFSWAGAFSLVLVATLAFVLGRQGNLPNEPAPVISEAVPVTAPTGLDTRRLLTSSVSGHLEQLNLVFTEFVNTTELSAADAGQITDMLVANRLYRQAAITRGDLQLASFLSGLEPVLIELAHEAYNGSPATYARMQQEIRDTLLFRIRVMNKQLDNPNIST
jgi:hypothetical protein